MVWQNIRARLQEWAGISIRLKLILGFNLFLIALTLLAFFALRELNRSRDISSQIESTSIARIEHATHIGEELSHLRSYELEYIAAEEWALLAQARADINRSLSTLDEAMADYRETFQEEEPLETFLRFQLSYSAYLSTHDQILGLADEGRTDDALLVYSAATPFFTSLEEEAHSLRHLAQADAEQSVHQQKTVSDRTRNILIGGLVGLALLIFAVGHPVSLYIDRRLRSLTEGAERVSRSDFTQSIAPGNRDEFGVLARRFNRMMESLQATRDEVAKLHAQALRLREERIALLQQGLTRVVEAQENERQRIARELHDQAGQSLTALQLGLSRIEEHAQSPELQEMAATLRAGATEAMETIRSLALDLRPSALDELGLVPALRDYIRTFAERVHIPVDLHFSPFDGKLTDETKLTLFRITQEGLTNIAKHSQATHVTVDLRVNGSSLRLVIEDNGVGFDVEQALESAGQKSLGLFGMLERCHLIGSNLDLHSEPGKGTRLTVTVPLPRPAPDPDSLETADAP
jgi:signal transduction histidine kinase